MSCGRRPADLTCTGTSTASDSGDHNVAGIAALFNVSRPTVYRSLQRTATLPPLPADTRPMPDVAKYDQLLTQKAERHTGSLPRPR